MSRRGEWKKDGVTIQIAQMEEGHLRNSLRYLYRKINELQQPDPRLPAPPLANTWRSPSAVNYYEDKLVELGEEAQRRNYLPPQLTFQQLMTILADWENQARINAQQVRYQQQIVAAPIVSLADLDSAVERSLIARAEAPPNTISLHTDVIGEVEKTIGLKLKKQNKRVPLEKVERNLSFEL